MFGGGRTFAENIISNLENERLKPFKKYWIAQLKSINIMKSRARKETALCGMETKSWSNTSTLSLFLNLINIYDRRWNLTEDHHSNQQWKSKMIQEILCFAVLNAWTWSTRIKYTEWIDWRFTLATKLMNFNSDL
jgi:hypothetical protein